jgi:hypothetical protein
MIYLYSVTDNTTTRNSNIIDLKKIKKPQVLGYVFSYLEPNEMLDIWNLHNRRVMKAIKKPLTDEINNYTKILNSRIEDFLNKKACLEIYENTSPKIISYIRELFSLENNNQSKEIKEFRRMLGFYLFCTTCILSALISKKYHENFYASHLLCNIYQFKIEKIMWNLEKSSAPLNLNKEKIIEFFDLLKIFISYFDDLYKKEKNIELKKGNILFNNCNTCKFLNILEKIINKKKNNFLKEEYKRICDLWKLEIYECLKHLLFGKTECKNIEFRIDNMIDYVHDTNIVRTKIKKNIGILSNPFVHCMKIYSFYKMLSYNTSLLDHLQKWEKDKKVNEDFCKFLEKEIETSDNHSPIREMSKLILKLFSDNQNNNNNSKKFEILPLENKIDDSNTIPKFDLKEICEKYKSFDLKEMCENINPNIHPVCDIYKRYFIFVLSNFLSIFRKVENKHTTFLLNCIKKSINFEEEIKKNQKLEQLSLDNYLINLIYNQIYNGKNTFPSKDCQKKVEKMTKYEFTFVSFGRFDFLKEDIFYYYDNFNSEEKEVVITLWFLNFLRSILAILFFLRSQTNNNQPYLKADNYLTAKKLEKINIRNFIPFDQIIAEILRKYRIYQFLLNKTIEDIDLYIKRLTVCIENNIPMKEINEFSNFIKINHQTIINFQSLLLFFKTVWVFNSLLENVFYISIGCKNMYVSDKNDPNNIYLHDHLCIRDGYNYVCNEKIFINIIEDLNKIKEEKNKNNLFHYNELHEILFKLTNLKLAIEDMGIFHKTVECMKETQLKLAELGDQSRRFRDKLEQLSLLKNQSTEKCHNLINRLDNANKTTEFFTKFEENFYNLVAKEPPLKNFLSKKRENKEEDKK